VSYPGKPSAPAALWPAERRRKPNREAAIPQARRGQGVADPRIVADDSGPMKPGNSVEDKTLTTEIAREGRFGRSAAPAGRGKPWTRGESDSGGEPTQ